MEPEDDPLQAVPDSSSESDASPTFSFPSAPTTDLRPMPLRSSAGFTFDVVDRGQGAQQGILDLAMPEVTRSWEVDSSSSSTISTAEIVELVDEDAAAPSTDPEKSPSPSPSPSLSLSPSPSPLRNGGKGAETEDRSLPGRAESRYGILGQLIGSCDDIDRHCDVLDVVRKGVHNWRMVARMSGWLACRGCCHRPANCCHHSTGSPQRPPSRGGSDAGGGGGSGASDAGGDNVGSSSKGGGEAGGGKGGKGGGGGGDAGSSSGATVGKAGGGGGGKAGKAGGAGHARRNSQDGTSSAAATTSNCCSRRSMLSPLRHHHSSSSSASFAKRESLATASPPGPCCASSARRSGSMPLRSLKLSSSDELSVHVPPGMIGLAWLDTEPLLLTSKSYTFPAMSSFTLQELALESTRVIHHGYLHRVSIPEGKLGVAWVDGQAKVLEPGVHVLSCSSFAYTTADDRDSSHKEVALGPYRVVTVREDEVGIKYCNRKPHLLYAGRHLIDISKVEVFAGFESLKIRKTTASDLVACSRDEMMVEAQVSFRWQITAQDIAFARGASVPDIENAVVSKVKRAFAIVFWCLKSDEISEPYSQMRDDSTLHISGPMKAFSSDITKRCLESVVDLFDEGWSVTFWGMWFDSLKLKRYSRIRPMKGLQDAQLESKTSMARKKKVQIVLTED